MMPAIDVSVIEYPYLIALAIVLPALFAWLLRRSRRQRQQRLARLGSLDVVRRLVPATALGGGKWRTARLALAAALAGIAIAGPRWGFERTMVRSSGVDVVLAVDASLSMMATDEKPSRLERVKQEIRRLRELSPGDRVGLLAFAGRSYILSPITVDAGALDLFLDNLDPSIVGQAGSSIAQTINQGTNLLSLTKSGADKALVVMSDGEAFELQDDVIAAAKKAGDASISLVTVGFGTAQGSTIPIREGNTMTTKKDESGQVVISRYHPELLQAAATAAHGTFIPAESADKAARIKSALSRLRTQARTTQTGDNLTPRFQWFLLPAVLLLWLDTLLGGRHGRRRRHAAAAETAVAAALIASVLLTGCAPPRTAVDGAAAYKAKNYQRAAALLAQVARDDHSPGALYNYGTALIAIDSNAAAAEVLDRAAEKTDEETQYRARFNGGLAHLLPGLRASKDSASDDLKQALAHYKRVLTQRPADADAKWNYELALEKQKKGGGGGGGGGQSNSSPSPAQQEPKPQPTLAQRQAEQILGSAQREERDVQSKKQKQSRQEPPPGGKDW